MTKKIDDTQGEGSDLGVAGTLMACLVVLFLFFAASELEYVELFESDSLQLQQLDLDEEIKALFEKLEEGMIDVE